MLFVLALLVDLVVLQPFGQQVAHLVLLLLPFGLQLFQRPFLILIGGQDLLLLPEYLLRLGYDFVDLMSRVGLQSFCFGLLLQHGLVLLL